MALASTATATRKPLAVAVVFAALVGALIGAGIGFWGTPSSLAFTCVVIALAVSVIVTPIDLRHHWIPDLITYPGASLLAGLIVVHSIVLSTGTAILNAAAAVVVVLVAGVLMSRFGSLGLGDVKLAVVLTLGFAAFGAGAILSVFLIGFLTAFVAGIVLMARHRKLGSYLAFAPFLAAGAVCGAVLQVWA